MIMHPEICSEGKKEKHFFDKTEVFESAKGLKNYLKEFSDCSADRKTIDSTPRYIQIEEVPGRIVDSYSAKDLKRKKFILILRDPVSRQYSEYQMRIRVCLDYGHVKGYSTNRNIDDVSDHNEERGIRDCERVSPNYKPGISLTKIKFITFREWVKSENGQLEITRGHYKEHINNWIREGITRNQLFIINFQSLIYDTTDVSKRLALFLGLKKNWGQSVQLPIPKQTKPDTILDCTTFDELDSYYQKINKNLVTFINQAVDKPSDEPEFPDVVSSRNSCTPLRHH